MAPRSRRSPHTRSRTGCLTCRTRHVRCDEKRPTCSNCQYRQRQCVYLPVNVPERETRLAASESLPGMLAPWVAAPPVPASPANGNSPLDPFNCLPLGLTAGADQLLMYFLRERERPNVAKIPRDTLALTTKSPAGFRCILLIAGLHFRARTRNLDHFERVIIQQKVQCIQAINENLSDHPSAQDTGVISMIATLCMVEANLGNIQASQAHLSGLMTLLESRYMANSRLGLVDAQITTDVLLQRYVLACVRELIDHNEKWRLSREGWEHGTTTGWAAALGESAWIEDWLQALCVMPSCIVAPGAEEKSMGDVDTEIDARDTIRALRILTAQCDVRQFPLAEPPPALMAVNKLWVIRGGKHKSFFSAPLQIRPKNSTRTSTITNASTHAMGSLQSVLDISDVFPSASQKFRTPWAAFAICASIYMHTALLLWKLDRSVDSEAGVLTRWLVCIVKADLERTWPSVASGRRSRELWLWRLFVTTTHVEVLQMRDQTTAEKSHYQSLRAWFHGRIRLWCDLAGVREWEEVKAVLMQIAWPEDSPLEPFAEGVWNAAMA